MKERIQAIVKESVQVKELAVRNNLDAIAAAVEAITATVRNKGKVLIFGNGGSAADSQHIAAEFIGRFQKERVSLPAIALTTDTSILTALANDYGFDTIFARQIAGLGRADDCVLAISTSGASKNIIEGLQQARKMNIKTISLTGCGGGEVAALSDVAIIVPSKCTARIQESHGCIAHCICELVEQNFC